MKKIYGKNEIIIFFTNNDIEYLYEYKNGIESFDTNYLESDYYNSNLEEFELLTTKYSSFITSNSLADIYIYRTEKKGFGLFANSSIKKDSFIGIYLGVIQEADEVVHFDEAGYDTDYAWDYPDEIDGFPPLEINGKYSGNELRFVNHDDDPNLRVEHTIVNSKWYIFFVADRDISKDEELTISYGDAYWDTEYRELS